jgi:sulfite reductase (NADPH) flavoprotein alpha-component
MRWVIGCTMAVLGFGDRSFPAYCAFAAAVATAARERCWPELLPWDTVNRQSPQDFARWGRRLGAALGLELELEHQPTPPATETLTLVSRRDHGAAVGAPMAILRFALPPASRWQRLRGHGFTRFEAGDLLGVVPTGSAIPRFHSLASGARDGFIEIVVRRHPGGLASTQLTDLEPGQSLRGFLRPLAGFIRNNRSKRPIQQYFGLRDPDSDYLYDRELAQWQREVKLAGLALAASRGAPPRHVQNSLRQAAPQLLDAIRRDARIMVCGGRAMAGGVADTLADILKPEGLSPAQLKAADRYVEDVY